ncbi:MAG: hypothetical protein LQ337_006724 [Flavoplaca oasis]|nr:MAG: hypothetical protein LQ337_006724 [Flavoplaca oasis]
MTIKRFISSFAISMGFALVAHIIRTLTPKPFLSRFNPFGWFLAPLDISNPIVDPIIPEWSTSLILALFPVIPVAVIELFIWSLWDFMAALGAGSNSGMI